MRTLRLRIVFSVIMLAFAGTATVNAQVSSFERYHTLSEIEEYMSQLATIHPGLASHKLLGKSQAGRDISMLVLKSPSHIGKEAVYFNGTHHGNEKSSTEAVLGIMKFILANRDTPQIKTILRRYDLVFQPVVNPDGHATNSRFDKSGRDPNRDYAYPNRAAADSFKTPEIRYVKHVLDTYDVKAAIAFHAGMEGVLWPWGYTAEPNSEQMILRELGNRIAVAMNFKPAQQSFEDYPTNGEFIDYAYMTNRALAFTVEVSDKGSPEEKDLPGYVENAVKGSLALLDGLLHVRNRIEAFTPSGKVANSETTH